MGPLNPPLGGRMSSTPHTYSPLLDTQSERNAYNMAFSELGLEWFWDADVYAEMQSVAARHDRIHKYLEAHRPHLLRAYDASFLTNAIESVRARLSPSLN